MGFRLVASLIGIGMLASCASPTEQVTESNSALSSTCNPGNDQLGHLNGAVRRVRTIASFDGFSRQLRFSDCNGQPVESFPLPRLDAAPGNDAVAHGPYSGWKAEDLRPLADGGSVLLWSSTSGYAGLWFRSAAGNYTYRYYGPDAGWTPTAYVPRSNGSAALLWTHTSGEARLWELDEQGNELSEETYGPYWGWTAIDFQENVDGTANLLWRNTSGQASLWTLDEDREYVAHRYHGPYHGWTPVSFDRLPNGTTNLVWHHTSGQVNVWNLDRNLGYASHTTLAVTTAHAIVALRRVSDHESIALWNSTDGRVRITSSARETRFGDADGDGTSDVIARSGTTLETNLSSDDFTSTVTSELTGLRTVDAIVVGDVDNDHLADVVAQGDDDSIHTFLSFGDGTFVLNAVPAGTQLLFNGGDGLRSNSNGLVRIDSVFPPQPTPGSEVRITGSGFLELYRPAVYFGDFDSHGQIVRITNTEIRVIVPENAQDGAVTVYDQVLRLYWEAPLCQWIWSPCGGTSYCSRIECELGDYYYHSLWAQGGNLTILRVPTAPSRLRAQPTSAFEVRLAWQDNSDNEQGFVIESFENGGWAEVIRTAANVTTQVIASADPATTYRLRVRSFFGGLVGPSGPEVDVTTLDAPSLIVSNADTIANGSATIHWQRIRRDVNGDGRIAGQNLDGGNAVLEVGFGNGFVVAVVLNINVAAQSVRALRMIVSQFDSSGNILQTLTSEFAPTVHWFRGVGSDAQLPGFMTGRIQGNVFYWHPRDGIQYSASIDVSFGIEFSGE